jgi:broad specificity phosphatase PhoE
MQSLSHPSSATAEPSSRIRSLSQPAQKVGTVLVIRHGDTKSADKIGAWDDMPLTTEGRKESTQSAQMLSVYPVSRIYTSDLERAVWTAKAVQQANPNHPPIVRTMALRSWNLGRYAGQPKERGKVAIEHYEARPEDVVPGGESFVTFLKRILPFLAQVFQDALRSGDTVAIVTHNRPSKLLQVWLDAGCDLAKVKWDQLEEGGMDTGGAMRITITDRDISRKDL